MSLAATPPTRTPSAPAREPPEARGLARDEVRMLVARPDGLELARARDLPEHLRPGDVVLVKASRGAELDLLVDGLVAVAAARSDPASGAA